MLLNPEKVYLALFLLTTLGRFMISFSKTIALALHLSKVLDFPSCIVDICSSTHLNVRLSCCSIHGGDGSHVEETEFNSKQECETIILWSTAKIML